jgi:hypothetical protein
MATYKFEQFNIDIVNPTIEANEDSIALQPTLNTISVDVTLTTESATFGVRLEEVQVNNLNYEGKVNLLERVNERLQDFIK